MQLGGGGVNCVHDLNFPLLNLRGPTTPNKLPVPSAVVEQLTQHILVSSRARECNIILL